MGAVLEVYPRLHLGLLDTAGVSRRLFGGAGFSLQGGSITLIGESNASHQIICENLSTEEVRWLTGLLEEANVPGTSVRIDCMLDRHIGLGTGTLLSTGVLACAAYCHELPLSSDSIAFMSRRGGTSGIGWHSIWRGGFIVDAGQPNEGQAMRPSSNSIPRQPPPLLICASIPAYWRFTLLMPSSGQRVSGAQERGFFEKNTPTSPDECLNAFHSLYHSIAPAVVNSDLTLLAEGLQAYQGLGLKKVEIAYQSESVGTLINALRGAGIATGMSSSTCFYYPPYGRLFGGISN
jgi:beta-ribofuranosylaminobenzene 5'-phosphate synthase